MSKNTEPQTPGQARLEAMRAEVAKLQSEEASTPDETSAPVVVPGDLVHVLESGMTIPRTTSLWGGAPALQLTRGDVFTVTREMIEASRDRHGNLTWPAMVHGEDAQIRRWGAVRLRPGPAPAGMHSWVYGDAQWSEERETARRAAWAETDPERRKVALQRVIETYGAAPTTSTVHAVIKGDRAYDEQQQRIAASAAAGVPNIGPSSGGE
jgi:hypothetical protein